MSNEINEDSCNMECASHELFWIDLCRYDECSKCKISTKRAFSYHHYIFDIPFDKILEISDSSNLVEFNKKIKIKGKMQNNEANGICDLKGKLFFCLKNLILQNRIECNKCNGSDTKRFFVISSFPKYFLVNLNLPNNSSCLSSMDILKTYLMIPGLFDSSSLFEYNKEQ
jgi:hypothetical protein